MTHPGEREIIASIRQAAGISGDLVVGIGDDCAVYKTAPDRLSLVTTDTMVEGVHFDLSWHPPAELGRKAASVNISDIAAMGGLPRFALLSLALAPAFRSQWLAEFMAGFLAVLSEHGVVLIGGDTVQSGHESVLSVTVIGEMAEAELITRKGARPGDAVMVSGFLGEAAAGLALCRLGLNHDPGWQPLVAAHLDNTKLSCIVRGCKENSSQFLVPLMKLVHLMNIRIHQGINIKQNKALVYEILCEAYRTCCAHRPVLSYVSYVNTKLLAIPKILPYFVSHVIYSKKYVGYVIVFEHVYLMFKNRLAAYWYKRFWKFIGYWP